jgi:hypothetical protein
MGDRRSLKAPSSPLTPPGPTFFTGTSLDLTNKSRFIVEIFLQNSENFPRIPGKFQESFQKNPASHYRARWQDKQILNSRALIISPPTRCARGRILNDFSPVEYPIPTKCLIDSGADVSLVSTSLVTRYTFATYSLPSPISISIIDGSVLPSTIIHSYTFISFRLNDKCFTHKFFVLPSIHVPMVLGLDWLRRYNPKVNWKTLNVSFETLSENPLSIEPIQNIDNDDKVRNDNIQIDHITMFINSTNIENSIQSTPINNPAEDEYVSETLSVEPEEIRKIIPLEYHQYVDVFSKMKSELLPEHRKYDIPIELKEGKTAPWGPIYPLSKLESECLKEYINENLSKGYIRPSKSPAGAPIFFVKKKSGELRPVIDYRQLNEVTIRNRYPLPLIHDLLTRFNSSKIFSKIDLRSAYNLVRVRQGDEWKTSFRSTFGQFEYLVMPFGLTNAPAVFQTLMNDIFRDIIDVFCIVYLDDILIYSQTLEDHINHVSTILQRLRENHLFAKAEKCQFHVDTIEFLGYIISDQGISMDPERVKSISSWPQPTKVKELQSFLGFANFYRMFIPNYSAIVLPLLKLLKKDIKYEWTQDCEEAFNKLKKHFIQGDILAHADLAQPFILETDASDFAVGGILSQKQGEDIRPIAFYSRKMTPAEINYEIHDKELLAIIVCLYQWRSLLLSNSHPIDIRTDHRNLVYFTSAQKLNRRQARWSSFLADFDIKISYVQGKLNEKPDALSRRQDYQLLPDDRQVQNQIKTLIEPNNIVVGNTTVDTPELYQMIRMQQLEDPELNNLIEIKQIELRDDLYYHKTKVFIPKSLVSTILSRTHDSITSGHPGNRKTFTITNRQFWWPKMRTEVNDYVQSCQICTRAKARRLKPAGLLMPLPIPPRPWYSLSMDFITDLPESQSYDAILVIVDRFSKMAHFIPCTKTTSTYDLAQMFIKEIIRIHGLPYDITSDRGPQFVSQLWKSILDLLNIKRNLSTAYHPQTDGQTERVNQCLEQYLRIYVAEDQLNWTDLLPTAELAYNTVPHDSTELSPFQICYGYEPTLFPEIELIPTDPISHLDWIQHISFQHSMATLYLQWTQENMKRQADKRRRQHSIKVNDLVYLNRINIKTQRPCKKLDWKQFGPFRVLKQINPVTFQLELPASMRHIHDVFHSSLLTPASKTVPEHLRNTIQRPPPLLVDKEGPLYEVEDILDSKMIHDVRHYLIAWKGYGTEDNTWEPEANLTDCDSLIEDFKLRFPNKFHSRSGGGNVRNDID